MFSRDKIVEIIESDCDFDCSGSYSKDFKNDDMVMCFEYHHSSKLGATLAFQGQGFAYKTGNFIVDVAIIADDGQQMVLRDKAIDNDDGFAVIEYWLVNKDRRLTAGAVWHS